MPDHVPDATEKALRLGCGAIAGFVLGCYIALELWAPGSSRAIDILITAIATLLCAGLAMRHGDRFWYGLWRFWRNWVSWP
jgi:hypothetical protein